MQLIMQAFTDTLSNPRYDPVFSVDNAAFWISSLGYQPYFLHDEFVISSTHWGPEDPRIHPQNN